MLHISQIDHARTDKVEDVLSVGDEVKVKVTEIDRQGRINLSRKVLLEKPEKEEDKRDTNRKKEALPSDEDPRNK